MGRKCGSALFLLKVQFFSELNVFTQRFKRIEREYVSDYSCHKLT